MNFNKVLIAGNLTRDPELRYTGQGAAVCDMGLAINRKFRQGDEWKEDVCFIDVTAWKGNAENCGKYLRKGSPVFVEGYLTFHQWENDGGKRSKVTVTANNVQFLGGKQDAGNVNDDEDVPF